MTGLQVTGHFHRYGHVGSTEMGGAKHFERPWWQNQNGIDAF